MTSGNPALEPPSSREEKEIDNVRDRLDEDEGKSSETFSTIVRTAATGLTLIFYTFLTSDKPSSFFGQHFEAMRAGSVIGLLALVADGLQYASALAQIAWARRSIEKGVVPETLDGVVAARGNGFGTLRSIFFWLKSILAAAGVIIVIAALAQAQAPSTALMR